MIKVYATIIVLDTLRACNYETSYKYHRLEQFVYFSHIVFQCGLSLFQRKDLNPVYKRAGLIM